MATRIYVGNLPYSATNEQLAQYFTPYGEVVEATVVIDRSTGQSKGFGFVEMAQDDEAHKAIEQVNGVEWESRALRVNEARERPDTSRRDDFRQRR
ncbi:MAG: RNA-binding protein [Ktedonobacterales bacterium]